jgi:hypothetical protein
MLKTGEEQEGAGGAKEYGTAITTSRQTIINFAVMFLA